MTAILVFVAVVLGGVAAVAFWMYGKSSPRKPGRVRPDAPPGPEERKRARGE